CRLQATAAAELSAPRFALQLSALPPVVQARRWLPVARAFPPPPALLALPPRRGARQHRSPPRAAPLQARWSPAPRFAAERLGRRGRRVSRAGCFSRRG